MERFFWPLQSTWKRVTQHYGSIWSANSAKKHTGVDIAVAPGNMVYAVATGTICKIGALDTTGAWAKYVTLEHDTGGYCTAYLHIEPQVIVGQKLAAGDIIGTIAAISAPHCHFNVWRGVHDEKLTPRGALPIVYRHGDDPIFPNNFVDPLSFDYQYIDSDTILSASAASLFVRDLILNDSGPDVKLLQVLLNKDSDTAVAATGPGSPGQETDHFGGLTEKAVQKFQVKHGIVSPDTLGYGTVGPRTRAKMQEVFGGMVAT